MNVAEKRDFIQNHLHQADEKLIEQVYEILSSSQVLKSKLESRAIKSEDDILNNKLYSIEDVKQKS